MKPTDYKYSVVIPVYNSENIVAQTVVATAEFFKQNNFKYEILLINDGSKDGSWKAIEQLAKDDENVVSINLLKNYGQHTAVLCGIDVATGDYLITMDDDGQNPPQEIIHLINKIHEGYDLVFAQFKKKKHSFIRRLGTKMIDYLNIKVFNKPKDLILTNFRIFSSEVAERIRNYKTNYPYIPGLVLICSSSAANTMAEHKPRLEGKSNYNIFAILKLIARLLFNYSSFPLKFLSTVGITISLVSMSGALFYLFKAILYGSNSPGFPTLVVLVSFLSGFIIIMLGIIGEYLARIMNQMASGKGYYIKRIVKKDL